MTLLRRYARRCSACFLVARFSHCPCAVTMFERADDLVQDVAAAIANIICFDPGTNMSAWRFSRFCSICSALSIASAP